MSTLITTAVAAGSLDIKNVVDVVNYDLRKLVSTFIELEELVVQQMVE